MKDRLPVPIRSVLRSPLDADRLAHAHARLRTRIVRRRGYRLHVAAALLACAVIVAGVAASLRAPADGPLRVSDGSAVPATLAVPSSSGITSFDDGSEITLGADAVLRTLENQEREVGFLLEHGTVTFEVHPAGPRRWTIECGLATVIVVGTRFTIERTEDRARITVARGAVLVRGERVPDRARRLGPGDSLVIVDDPPVVAAAPEPAPAAEPTAPRPPSETADRSVAGARPEPRPDAWRAYAAGRDWERAYTEIGEDRGIARASRTATVPELVALADVARLSGHPSAAVPPLEQIVSRHPRDPTAPLSAFSLGRVEGQLGHHQRAARAFALALDLGLPPSLRSDALARLATSHRDAGDRAAAVEAASRYLDEFPRERHADAMREMVGAQR